MNFGEAYSAMEMGAKMKRAGWNGNNIFVKMQRPDANSFMTAPYLYIDTTVLLSDNPDAVRCRVPWVPTQTDMAADDWDYTA